MQDPKIHHLGTIAQFCLAISLQLRHVSTIGKKNLLNSNVSPTCLHSMVNLRLTSSWDPLACLGHPSKFQLVARLGSVTARHSSSGRQPKFVALNTGHHLHSEGRPSCWALAHILVLLNLFGIRLKCYWKMKMLMNSFGNFCSDVGIYDRVVIQELLKTVAQSHQLDSSSQRDFKGWCACV